VRVDLGVGEPLLVRLHDQAHRDRRLVALEDRTGLGQVGLVRFTAVVEPRGDVDREGHLPSHTPHHPHDPVPSRGERPGDRHEVGHLADPGLSEEARDPGRGVGEVQLLAGERVSGRPDPEAAPRSRSSSAPKMLGESNRGAQNQSMEPSLATNAEVWRSPMRPWSTMSG
jgi:hypothetical protein